MNHNEAGAPSNLAPILGDKSYAEPAVFIPANLLREARQQKTLAYEQVPRICVLDSVGDLVERLRETGCAEPDPYWACYHTRLYNCTQGNFEKGMAQGSVDALRVVSATAGRWLAWNEQDGTSPNLPESSAGDVSGGSKR